MGKKWTLHVMMLPRHKLDITPCKPSIIHQHVSVAFGLEIMLSCIQLTHCWLGMAIEVSTSAMAPNIWSVRPWFFCRAFILPQHQAKAFLQLFPFLVVTFDLQHLHNLPLSLSLLVLYSSCPPVFCSFSSCLTAHCHSLELSHHSPPCSTQTLRKPHAYE